MLLELIVENFGIVGYAKIEFNKGFTVLTGETGAGKSLIVEALGIVLGDRGYQRFIKSDEKEAVTSARFDISEFDNLKMIISEDGIDIEDDQLIIKRTISRDGKNKIYINGNMVTLSQLSNYGSYLLEIHGQHEAELLYQPARHLDFLDRFMNKPEIVKEYNLIYLEFIELKNRIDNHESKTQENERKRDLYRYQLDEIEKIDLKVGDDEKLKEEQQILGSIRELMQKGDEILSRLDGEHLSVTRDLSNAKIALEKMVAIDKHLETMKDQLLDALITIEDFIVDFRSYLESLEDDPDKLRQIEDRLDDIYSLKKKYGKSIEEILDYKQLIKKELGDIEDQTFDIGKMKSDLIVKSEKIREVALKLNDARLKASEVFKKKIEAELKQVGIANPKIEFNFRYKEDDSSPVSKNGKNVALNARGIEEVEILFSANPGENPGSLSKIGSGGEISRVMLSIKSLLIENYKEKRTLIFDEIDAGIGGATADKVGERLKKLAGENGSVLSVTHLAQVARFAKNHILITKSSDENKTEVKLKKLNLEERVEELARMATGEKAKHAALIWAREALLDS